MLPDRKKSPSSGILRAPPRVFQRHRKWLRSHDCVVTLKVQGECSGVIEVSHLRTAANSGTGLKPMDDSAVPMCSGHHEEFHRRGPLSFEKKYGLNLAVIAKEFAEKTPDTKLKEAMKCCA